MPAIESKFGNLAKRLISLSPGRYFAVVVYYGRDCYYTIKEMDGGQFQPIRLKETVIEDALTNLNFGTYFWTIQVTPHTMAIEGRRVGRVES